MICDVNGLELNAQCFRCLPKGSLKEVWIYLLCLIQNKGIPLPVPPTFAQIWSARVVANGGAAPSAATVAALDTFYNSLVGAGLDTKMISVNCFVPDNLIASITPLIKTSGNDPWTNHNFVAGDLTVNGLVGDAATKYLETGVTPSLHIPTDTSAGFTVYNTVGHNQTSADLGAQDGAGNIGRLIVSLATTASNWDCWNATTDRVGVANSVWTGYLSGDRTANNVTTLYKASSSVPHQSIASSANVLASNRPTVPVFCFALNNNGVAANFSSHQLSFAAIHTGLSAADSLAFYNAIKAVRTSLGGGTV